MTSTLVSVFALIGLILLVAFVAIENPFGVKTTATNFVQQQVTKYQTGDQIAFNLPPLQPILPSNQTGSNIVEKQTASSSTTVTNANQSNTTGTTPPTPVSSGNTSIVQRSYTGGVSLQGVDSPTSIGIPTIKIGSIVVISGQISIIDPITKQKVQPPYQFQLSITCHFRDDCNNNSNLSVPPQYTDTLGGFEYHWTTNSDRDKPGEYIATINTLSQTPDPTGKPYALTSEYRFELVS